MTSNAVSNNQLFITSAIQERITREANEVYDNLKSKLMKELEDSLNERREEIIAKTAVQMTRTFEMQTMGDRVTVSFTNFKYKE